MIKMYNDQHFINDNIRNERKCDYYMILETYISNNENIYFNESFDYINNETLIEQASDIRQKLSNIWETIKRKFLEFFNFIKIKFRKIMNFFKKTSKSKYELIEAQIKSIINKGTIDDYCVVQFVPNHLKFYNHQELGDIFLALGLKYDVMKFVDSKNEIKYKDDSDLTDEDIEKIKNINTDDIKDIFNNVMKNRFFDDEKYGKYENNKVTINPYPYMSKVSLKFFMINNGNENDKTFNFKLFKNEFDHDHNDKYSSINIFDSQYKKFIEELETAKDNIKERKIDENCKYLFIPYSIYVNVITNIIKISTDIFNLIHEYFNKFNFTIRLKSEIDKEMKENGGI